MVSLEAAEELVKDLNVSAPYVSFAARFASFKEFVYDKRFFAKCSSAALANAGFYSTATHGVPSAKCPFCCLERTFEENDDPWKMHSTERPDCEFVKLGKPDEKALSFRTIVNLALRCATISKYYSILEDISTLEKSERNPISRVPASKNLITLRNAAEFLTYGHRVASFENVKIDKKGIPKAAMKKLAKAGYHSAATPANPSFAMCSICHLKIKFNEVEDVWAEHQTRSSDCDFVKLGKLDEKDWTADEAMKLAARAYVMRKYRSGLKLVDELEKNEEESGKFSQQLIRLMAKPKNAKRRCSV